MLNLIFESISSAHDYVIQYRRMETEANANSHRCFFGDKGLPLRLCSRRIDKGGLGQYYSNMSFD